MVWATVKNARISVIFILCSITNQLEGYLDVSFVIYLFNGVCACVLAHVEYGGEGMHMPVYVRGQRLMSRDLFPPSITLSSATLHLYVLDRVSLPS